MRVGLVTGEYPPMQGGVGDFTRQLGQALARLGVETHVVTSRRAAASGPAGVSVYPVINHWSFVSLPIHFLPRWAGLPVVVTFHDLRVPYLFPKAGSLRSVAVTHLARSAAGVIVTTPADEAELQRRGRVGRLRQIPIGSNIAPAPPPGYDRANWRAELGVRPNELLLGYFGCLNESKGADTLISALAILQDRKAPVRLLHIGGLSGFSDVTNQAFELNVARQIARYDLYGRFIQTGFVDNAIVSAHLLACDVVVLPYRDGVSFRRGSLMAALAHGCAVISTEPAQPLPELRDGENIRLVPPASAPALVLAISELLQAPERRRRGPASISSSSARPCRRCWPPSCSWAACTPSSRHCLRSPTSFGITRW